MLYIRGNSLSFLRAKMQNDLDNLADWLYVNDLKLNVAKTKSILFNAEGLMPNVELSLNKQPIECVCDFKFLGVHLDNTLNFDSHYLVVYKKLLQAEFLICKLSTFLPSSCLRTLYYAYFHANLSYCLLIWYPLLKKSQQNVIYVKQKQIVRMIAGVN